MKKGLYVTIIASVIIVSTPVTVFGTSVFDVACSWRSADERGTCDIALADFNGDGWREVTGETKKPDGESKVFYVDHFPALTVNAVRVDGALLPRTDYCFDARAGWISLGDAPPMGSEIEVDYIWSNKLDLYAANRPLSESDGRDVIYFNGGDSLNNVSGWISEHNTDSWECAAADYDNDGDVDIVIAGDDDIGGYGGEFIRLYENNGTGLEQEPAWSFEVLYFLGWVRDLCWGDVDNDGYLELTVADTCTPYAERFSVFKNNGGVLEDSPYWYVDGYEAAFGVAWGDADGDGDMDLAACTNHSGAEYGDGYVYLFRNNYGVLETEPCWNNGGLPGKCSRLVWGDANNDGEMDLVKGISGTTPVLDHYTDIYYSENGVLPTEASWESKLYTHVSGIVLADCDCDGEMDMFHSCGAIARGYFSSDGEMENYPSWKSYMRPVSHSIEVGDINGDGLFDLAVGRTAYTGEPIGNPNLVYYNNGNIGVGVKGFEATAKGDNVVLTWVADSSYAGFNLYRSVETARGAGETRINVETISGRSPYLYVDTDVEPGTTYSYWLEAIDGVGVSERFGPATCTVGSNVPSSYALYQSRPNPAKGTATVAFDLPEDAKVTLTVYDISGRKVTTLVDETLAAGEHERKVSALAPGVYVYKLDTAEFSAARKMVIR